MDNLLVLAGHNLSNLNLDKELTTHSVRVYDRQPTITRYIVPKDFQLSEIIKQQLSKQQIDWALLPIQSFSDLGLVVSDMDSTLITIECIDEIADMAGLKEQISEITEQTMQGQLDFEVSLRKRVSLLKGLTVHDLEEVLNNRLQLSTGAKFLIEECHEHGIKFILVSGGFTFFTDFLRDSLRLTATFSNILEIEQGVLTGKVVGEILDASVKARYLKQYQAYYQLNKSQVLAIGDGANDIEMMLEAGISVAYHAKPKTKEVATLSVDFGGLDFVRYCFI